jgi:hypothetical protein
MIGHYQVVWGEDLETINQAVQKLIEEGWQPVGAVIVDRDSSSPSPWFYQTMTKEKTGTTKPGEKE